MLEWLLGGMAFEFVGMIVFMVIGMIIFGIIALFSGKGH